MSDIRKLFRRDRLYWLIMAVLLMGTMIYTVGTEWLPYMHAGITLLQNRTEQLNEILQGDLQVVCHPGTFLFFMLQNVLAVALVGQIVKTALQETKNRREVQGVFPIKKRNIFVYDYVSGLLLIVIPALIQLIPMKWIYVYVEEVTGVNGMNYAIAEEYILRIIVFFLLEYALWMLCVKITNHIPGAMVVYALIHFAIRIITDADLYEWLWADPEFAYENPYMRSKACAVCALVALILIILTYLADQRKDFARNGVCAYWPIHWMVLALVFGELCYVLHDAVYWRTPNMIVYCFAVILALAITVGLHHFTKPKNV